VARLVRNAARCLLCNTVVESRHRHDFQSCPCDNLFVDGGLAYERYGVMHGWETMERMCEYEEES
jgi:hypothetical protein